MYLKKHIYFILLLFVLTKVNSQTIAKIDTTNKDNLTSLVFLNAHLAINSKAIGGKYIASIGLKNNANVGLGFNLAYEKIWLSDNVGLPKNANTDIWFATGGANVRYKIQEGVFFLSELSMLMGKQENTELITTSTTTYGNSFPYTYTVSYSQHEEKEQKTIYGAHIEEHFFYHPKKAKGLVIGASVYARFLNAKYYESDFGLCGYLGIKL